MKYPKLMIYSWNIVDGRFMQALDEMGASYIQYDKPMQDYHADSNLAQDVIQLVIEERVEAVFSYDYFPLLSMVCEVRQIPYIAWIYDCPVYTLQSRTLRNTCNYIFCFDALYAVRLQKRGAVNCIHFPLAGRSDLKRKIECAQSADPDLGKKYSAEISFVGGLYNDSKNRLKYAELTSYTAGYIEGIVQAQSLIYGCNFIKAALNQRVVDEIVEKCQLSLGNLYERDDFQMAADTVGLFLTGEERAESLKALSECGKVCLYSSSDLPEELGKKIDNRGYADYKSEMPYVFYNSKINLNVTSRVIESGIPLRVFDILSCGGFCLTNYQPEIAEYFENGKELVMYSDREDMQKKADYYLSHEEERKEICRNGHNKIKKEFELSEKIDQMFSIVFSG